MIPYQRLDLREKARYDKYRQSCGERGCEYSFTNLFLWGRQKAAFVDDYLVLLSQFDRRSVYPYPLGKGDPRAAIDAIIADAEAHLDEIYASGETRVDEE